MHELGLIQEVLEVVSREGKGAPVRRIVLRVGKLAAVLPEALRFAFEHAREGTVAEGATLEIVEVPGRARCRACGVEVELERPIDLCACGSANLDWLAGEELELDGMEVG